MPNEKGVCPKKKPQYLTLGPTDVYVNKMPNAATSSNLKSIIFITHGVVISTDFPQEQQQ